MGLLSDALRHLLATDPVARRAGLSGLVGRIFGAAPVAVRHRANPRDLDFELVHFPKTRSGLAPRSFAITMTIGLSEGGGRELMALTLADVQQADNDPVARLLCSLVEVARGGVAPLPERCLGRSSHVHAVVTEPWPLSARDLPDYERVVGGVLDLVVPITARESDWVGAHGVGAFVGEMQRQGVLPAADRPAGQTTLPD